MALKLSFIIPCYNVEKYIRHCLESIYAITLQKEEYEVLCFDDGSKDKTAQIIDNYANLHANMHVYHSSFNVGISRGRNYLIDKAKGMYVWFVDSDDSVCSENVQSLLDVAIRGHLDVLAFNFNDLNDDGTVLKRNAIFKDTQVYKGVDFVKNIFGEDLSNHIGFVWRFLYRREYLLKNNIFFPDGNWEDTVYMPKAMILAERMQSTSIVGYEYWHHSSSICRTMERKYPGKMLYEFSFVAGVDLFSFSNEIKDEELKDRIRNIAIKDYFNWFPPYLCRTRMKERCVFYQYLSENRDRVNVARKYMRFVPKVLTIPILGPIAAEIVSMVYYIKHMHK